MSKGLCGGPGVAGEVYHWVKSLMLMGWLIPFPFAWPEALGEEGVKDTACQKHVKGFFATPTI